MADGNAWEVGPRAQQFLIGESHTAAQANEIEVVLNWRTLLEERQSN